MFEHSTLWLPVLVCSVPAGSKAQQMSPQAIETGFKPNVIAIQSQNTVPRITSLKAVASINLMQKLPQTTTTLLKKRQYRLTACDILICRKIILHALNGTNATSGWYYHR